MNFARIICALTVAVFLGLIELATSTVMPAPGTSDAASYAITIKDFQFSPRNLEIPLGSKVTWINKDEEPHKVAQINAAFTSQPLETDEVFSYEFRTAGKYEYFCTIHPRMTGTIVVDPK